MQFDIHPSWQAVFTQEVSQPYFNDLLLQVAAEYQEHTCFPPQALLFNAFSLFSMDDLKVVVIGQDPYHGVGEANGLCFSVNDGVAIPPSLKNIFLEINREYDRLFFPTSGNLERWARQGVLLLNAGLSVRKDLANSHKHLKWGVFTDAVIQYISDHTAGVVFMLWGSFAQKKGRKIDPEKHLVLSTGHPSPLSANRGLWFGHDHFKLANAYLKSVGKAEIEW